ncbi:restriction endonuclease subunit S [Staphylococcus arlettae]|uniref:restriction endonuclease subunit S n=1 Tax=Staphylococcus arlettae TaxID=29378 RepID=UPI000D1A331F|nr:restriction endonuclease subunit S [Staphylococcus arlettae]PUZ31118.1 restriction endonuclease subunit S [Staphylococcus arlettae]
MTNELKNVPELRFSEFDGVWENSKLGTVANVYDGTHQTPKYTIEGIKFLSVENIKTLNSNKFISKEAFEKEFKIRPEFGDVLMTRIGDVGTPNVIETNEDLAYYVSLALLKPKKLNSYFLESLIRSQTVQNELWRKTLHIAFPKKINKNEIAKVEINYPEQMEQQKIGEFFSKLDRQIELEEQKLAKLEEQKKGYMQQIFSQELRFKDENGNDYPTWKKTTIKEVAKLTVGKSKKNENTGKYIIMDMGTVTKNGTMLTHKSTPHENGLLNKGDLVMPKDDIGGGHIIGKTVFIPESQKYVLGDHVYRLETKKCNGLFLHFYINSDIVNRSLKRKVTGSAQLGLNRKSVEEELVKVPCLEEQEKIGAFFSKLDTFIEKQLSKIELLKERKKGFLQKMFV